MANTQKYLNHLLQRTGITPACSEEERAAADTIAQVFAQHGFEPEIQEFSSSSSPKIATAVLGIALFVGSVFVGIGGILGVIGFVLTVLVAVLYVLDRTGNMRLPQLGAAGLSQNVIAFHKAAGPLASPRNRPVVVVAHYDSPRADILSKMPYATYRPLLTKLMPVSMIAPAVCSLLSFVPFPAIIKVLLVLLAVATSLVALANSVAIVLNRFVLPYTSGAVCNKSSVAAMLGVMDAVSPARRANEFPDDMPFDAYMAEQRSMFDVSAFAPAPAPTAREDVRNEEVVEGQFLPEDEEALPEQVDEPATVADETMAGLEVIAPVEQTEAPEPDALSATSTMQIPREELERLLAPEDEEPAAPAAEEAEPESAAPAIPVNAAGNIRFGVDALRALNMVPASCVIEYEQTEGNQIVVPAAPAQAEAPVEPAPQQTTAFEVVAPVPAPAAETVPAAEPVTEEPEPEPVAAPVAPVEEAPAAPVVPAYQKSVYGVDEGPVEDQQPVYDQASDPADEERLAEQDVYVDDSHAAQDSYEADSFDDALGELDPAEVRDEDVMPAIYEQLDVEPVALEDAGDGFSDEMEDEGVLQDEDVVAEEGVEPEPEPEPEDAIEFDDEELDETVDVNEAVEASIETIDDGAEEEPEAAVQPVAVEDEPAEAASPDQTVVAEPVEQLEPTEADKLSAPAPEAASDEPIAKGSTVAFVMPSPSGSTPTAPAAPAADEYDEAAAVDALMAEIETKPAARPKRTLRIPNVSLEATASVPRTISEATAAARPLSNRSALLDLPDPTAVGADPFANVSEGSSPRKFTVVTSQQTPDAAPESVQSSAEPIETITTPAPKPKKKRGLFHMFGRKKQAEDSMSDWLGVDEDFDAKRSGRDIGSWDNFDDDGWKGGATGAEGLTEADLREAVASLGDDELLGHDIWFVATGSSENGNAGMHAFLHEHRDQLRGVFIINLECVGAGRLAMVSSEGERTVLKADKRIMGLVSRVSSDFHHEIGAVEMPICDTDAYAALEMRLRALTIAGVDGASYALSHSEEDLPINVDVDNIALVSDVVTEVIRRS